MSTNDYMQTCNMDERTNEEKLRDTIDQQREEIERLTRELEEAKQNFTRCLEDEQAKRDKFYHALVKSDNECDELRERIAALEMHQIAVACALERAGVVDRSNPGAAIDALHSRLESRAGAVPDAMRIVLNALCDECNPLIANGEYEKAEEIEPFIEFLQSRLPDDYAFKDLPVALTATPPHGKDAGGTATEKEVR